MPKASQLSRKLIILFFCEYLIFYMMLLVLVVCYCKLLGFITFRPSQYYNLIFEAFFLKKGLFTYSVPQSLFYHPKINIEDYFRLTQDHI